MAKRKANPLKETIDWIPVTRRLPDGDAVVMIANEAASERVWFGTYEEGEDGEAFWRYADGCRIDNEVSHWAELPKGPDTAF